MASMYVPSTPTFSFTLPIETNTLSCAYVTVSQLKAQVLQVKLTEFPAEGNVLTVTLDQEQTQRFPSGTLQIQLSVLTKDGKRLNGRIFEVETEQCLCTEVITLG